MKNKITKFGFVLLLSVTTNLYAQTEKEKEDILSKTNVEFLNNFAEQEKAFFDKKFQLATEKAREKGVAMNGVNERGNYYQIVSYDPASDSFFSLETKNNVAGASSIKTIKVGYLHNNNIKGQNMLVGEWDGAVARNTHQALVGRVQVRNPQGGDANHATHVAGTMIANESAGEAKGMAPMATLASWNWTNDVSEMASAGAEGLLASNHSYGPDNYALKDAIGLRIFGRYTGTATKNAYGLDTSRDYDIIANNAPYYTIVFAAGNDRDHSSLGLPALNPTVGGRDLLVGTGTSKNLIVVGAINGISNYSGAGSVVMSSFSNWGPTDDFRIKPDIVAKGVDVYSALAANDQAYGSNSGTSMAAPSVTGAITLWQQLYKETLNGGYMRSSTVRALMAHTALEAGGQIGPDFKFGWGVFNTEGGAVVIQNVPLNKAKIQEITLSNNQIYQETFNKAASSDLIATIAWNDPAAEETSSAEVNFFAKALINDLDLRIINEDTGVEYLPYRLKNQWTAMQDNSSNEVGDNLVDNIEKVYIPAAPAGNYKLKVSHKGSLLNNSPQVFSLVLTGHEGVLSVEEEEFNKLNLYPNPLQDYLNISGDFNVLQGSEIHIYSMSGRLIEEKEINTESDLRINVSSFSSGNYILTINKNGASKSFKLVK